MSASCSLVVTFDDVACPTSRVNSTVTIAIASTCFFSNMLSLSFAVSFAAIIQWFLLYSTRKTCMLAACDSQLSFDLVFELLESERLVVLQLHAAKHDFNRFLSNALTSFVTQFLKFDRELVSSTTSYNIVTCIDIIHSK